jgi:uncharacterized membrane protein
MSIMLVLVHDNEMGAQKLVAHVQTLQKQQLLIVAEAAIVVRQADGRVIVKQVKSLVGSGMWGGAFWGLLIGLLFGQPWLGSAAGNTAENETLDCGLNAQFIEEIEQTIQRGNSALFLLVAYINQEKVLAELAKHDAKQLRINLSAGDEAKLCDTFGVVEGY